jgi:hypothetical protein
MAEKVFAGQREKKIDIDAAKKMARRIHEIYERRAPEFGYETRVETREFDPLTPNGRLMVAVCLEWLGGE